jgi:DNA-binding response OmpR family regulator
MNITTEENLSYRPCLVVAHTDPGYAALVCRSFRRLGWDVYEAGAGPEARRLARMLEAEWVVLETDLPEESGWLTCDKLVREHPHAKVILVGIALDARAADRAAFIGASALVDTRDGLPALLRLIGAPVLPVAG